MGYKKNFLYTAGEVLIIKGCPKSTLEPPPVREVCLQASYGGAIGS